MELIRGLHNLRPRHRDCVATIGNYDGVHLGHRAVLSQLAQEAKQRQLPRLVMIFEPMPREFFAPAQAPARIASLREKLEDLASAGVDRVLCLRFDAAFANLAPEVFIDQVLQQGLGVRYLAVGDDFHFGHQRRGDFALLQAAGKQQGFVVESLPALGVDGERVSSTRIRAALAAGEMQQATRLLGRPYRISGKVVGGKRLGRELGVPTANVPLTMRRAVRQGIYAARVDIRGRSGLPAVVSIGTRPTVAGEGCVLEAHLLDFDENLYGKRINVHLLDFMRAEQRFPDLESLRAQMLHDIREARVRLQPTTSQPS